MIGAKPILKRALSRKSQLAMRRAANAAKAGALLMGSSVTCPICRHSFFRFLSFCGRPNEWCPMCRSLGRHRLIWLYLRERTRVFAGGERTRVLHVGAESCLANRLRASARYVSADSMVSVVDLLEVAPDVRASVTALPFTSSSFDLVICSHVLEHVRDDRAAIGELFRVTSRGGIAIVPVPIDWQRATTDARHDLDALERARFYGQPDHVRQYGRDYLERLKSAGFEVETYQLSDGDLARRYRIDMADPLVIGHKPRF